MLWVRETWGASANHDGTKPSLLERGLNIAYRATDAIGMGGVWRPSIFMPRWASRILLEVVSVRVERVQEISEDGARAEGVTPFPLDYEGDCWTDGTHRTAFNYLWNEVYGWAPNSWQANPWVWVVEFKRVEG